jgi:polysaccharide export outer membrane protein
LLAAGGCGLPPLTAGTPGIVGEYRIAPPDFLSIAVSPEPASSLEVAVRPDGKISMELIGDVDVENRTVQEVRQEIEHRLGEFIVSPDVTVHLVESRSRRFYVFGQVRRPGSFLLIGRVSAAEALAEAGGGNLYANLNSSRLARTGSSGEEGEVGAFRIRYKDILERADGSTNYELRPDDIIWVPPTLSARIGFYLQRLLFPITSIFGAGREVAGTAYAF